MLTKLKLNSTSYLYNYLYVLVVNGENTYNIVYFCRPSINNGNFSNKNIKSLNGCSCGQKSSTPRVMCLK